jgi:AcrR family transcriptional regulator
MSRIVDRDTKRLQIVAAAAASFARSGYEATSMEAVAQAANVSKGSLYDYFESKEDLFYAVFEWFQQTLMLASKDQSTRQRTARERVLGFADAAVAGFCEHIELYPVTLEVWAAAAKTGTRRRFATAMRKLYAAYRREVTALLEDAQRRGEIKGEADPKVLASMLIGAIDGLLLQYWLGPRFDPRKWVREFIVALFDGIGAPASRKA